MKILCACEESQIVTIALRNNGHEAYSCDIQECSGGHPEWHIHGDVVPELEGVLKQQQAPVYRNEALRDASTLVSILVEPAHRVLEKGEIKMPKPNSDFIHCHECNRGGNGNDNDKCSCGWKVTRPSNLGCFLGAPIVGDIKPNKKLSKSKERYRRYLEYGDMFESFLHFCYWDSEPEREWNR